MTIIAPSSAALAAGLRPMTADENARLDWLRGQLRASGANVSDAAALDALVDSSRAGWARSGATTLPEAMVAALAVGLGDVLVARAPGATWVLRAADGTSGPAVVDASGQAVVLPFEDLRSRWVEGRVAWVPGYVDAAAAHLRVEPVVPQPRPVSDDVAPASPAPAPPIVPSTPAAPLPSRVPAAGTGLPRRHDTATGTAPAAALAPLPAAAPAPAQPHAPVLSAPLAVRTPTVAPTPASGLIPVVTVAPAAPANPFAPTPAYVPTAVVGAPALAPVSEVVVDPAPLAAAPPVVAAAPEVARPASPAELPDPPSAAVQDLVLRALEQALEVVLVGDDALPLVVVPDGGRWHVQRFAGGTTEDARAWLVASGATSAALAWVGELGGETAVLAEASEAGRPGLAVAHRFARRAEPVVARRHARAQVAEAVGELELLGQSAPVV